MVCRFDLGFGGVVIVMRDETNHRDVNVIDSE